MKTSYLFALVAFLLLSLSCKPKTNASVEVAVADWAEVEQEITLSDEAIVVDEDTTIHAMPPYTAHQKDALNYFRQNNRLKDWDPKKAKQVMVKAVIEKDGSLTRPFIYRYRELDPATNEWTTKENWQEDDFTREALRLIQEADIEAGRDKDGNFVRSEWMNVVFFPPK